MTSRRRHDRECDRSHSVLAAGTTRLWRERAPSTMTRRTYWLTMTSRRSSDVRPPERAVTGAKACGPALFELVWLDDGAGLDVDCRLSQQPPVDRCAGAQGDGGLPHHDPLHVSRRAPLDVPTALPKHVFGLCPAGEQNIHAI